MNKFSSFKFFGGLFLILVVRKIVIAFFAMSIVYNNQNDVSFEKLISNPSLKIATSSMRNNSNPSFILILNKHALNMTLNWLCNTVNIDGVHQNSYIVTLDKESAEVLRKQWPNISQINFNIAGLKDPFNYGDGYYQLFYLFRANLARALLHYNCYFWMIQQDTFWNDSLLNIDLSKNIEDDIIFDQASDSGPLVAGGYYLSKPNDRTKKFFQKLSEDISWWYTPDNAYMTSLCEVGNLAKCGRLSFHLITNWQWLNGISVLPPKFIQFDGETKLGSKLDKMKNIGFYFLNNDKMTCNQTSIKNSKNLVNNKMSQWEKVASYSHHQFQFYQKIVDLFYSTRIGCGIMNHFILPYAHFCMLSM